MNNVNLTYIFFLYFNVNVPPEVFHFCVNKDMTINVFSCPAFSTKLLKHTPCYAAIGPIDIFYATYAYLQERLSRFQDPLNCMLVMLILYQSCFCCDLIVYLWKCTPGGD